MTPEQRQQRIDDHIQKIWEGKALGFSEQTLRHDLDRYQQMQRDLQNRTITPRRVAGRGATRALAQGWITLMIQETEEALRTQGRSDEANQRNARWQVARDEAIQ